MQWEHFHLRDICVYIQHGQQLWKSQMPRWENVPIASILPSWWQDGDGWRPQAVHDNPNNNDSHSINDNYNISDN